MRICFVIAEFVGLDRCVGIEGGSRIFEAH